MSSGNAEIIVVRNREGVQRFFNCIPLSISVSAAILCDNLKSVRNSAANVGVITFAYIKIHENYVGYQHLT